MNERDRVRLAVGLLGLCLLAGVIVGLILGILRLLLWG